MVLAVMHVCLCPIKLPHVGLPRETGTTGRSHGIDVLGSGSELPAFMDSFTWERIAGPLLLFTQPLGSSASLLSVLAHLRRKSSRRGRISRSHSAQG